jgi:hypothetical protein
LGYGENFFQVFRCENKANVVKNLLQMYMYLKRCPPISEGSCEKRLAWAQDVSWIGRPAG